LRKLAKDTLKLGVQIGVFGIVVCFFLPWVVVNADMTQVLNDVMDVVGNKTGLEKVSGWVGSIKNSAADLSGTRQVASMSGFDLAKAGKSRVTYLMSDLLSLLGQSSKDPTRIVFLFAVPPLALFLGWLSLLGFKHQKIFLLISGLVSTAIALLIAFKLHSFSFDSRFAKVQIEYGIWLNCLFFGLMGLSALMGIGIRRRRIRL
jgi:hypothetical protein